ncbi:MAG: RDD family protein [Acidobacteria bacterium]|nr:RDD family protein [Acidobacteriota bacterium]
MSQSDRYIEEVMRLVVATREERERFAADLRAHFEEGLSRNQTTAELIFKLGTAEAVAEAFNAERPLAYAGFWRRLAAFFADISIFVLAAIPVVMTVVAMEAHAINDKVGVALMLLCALAIFGLSLTYFPLLEARFGKTLGKQLMRIRVIEENGRPLQLRQAVIRRLSFYFDLLAVDAIFIPFTPKKQRALDILAKTVVIEEPGEEVPAWAWAAGLFGWLAIVLVIVTVALPYL